jgi:hypothetical protein
MHDPITTSNTHQSNTNSRNDYTLHMPMELASWASFTIGDSSDKNIGNTVVTRTLSLGNICCLDTLH